VAPADGKSVAAIERLIGQTIAWAGEPPASSDSEDVHEARHGQRGGRGGRSRSERPRSERSRSERSHSERSHSERPHSDRPRDRHPPREHQPAPVASLETARPPRPAPREKAEEPGDPSHLPAFLFRPTRLKA
jgi:hypothetical protein